LEVLEPHSRLRGIDIQVACDVRTRFVDAAAVFSPQKGASTSQVELLTRRLERLAQLYLDQFGVDVQALEGSGAAGGLAGGLAAVGATLVGGFELVADRIELPDRIEGADLVITGEGLLDDQSFEGKSVGGVVGLAEELGVPVVVLAGDADPDQPVTHRTLVAAYGEQRAWADPLGCLTDLTTDVLRGLAVGGDLAERG
jgi:glycerate kinase